MNKPVVTTSTTDHQIREIDDWWRENRDKSPDLCAEELALAFRMLEAAPGIGRRYPHPGALVRRVLLRASRNHVTTWKKSGTWSSWPCGAPSKAAGLTFRA